VVAGEIEIGRVTGIVEVNVIVGGFDAESVPEADSDSGPLLGAHGIRWKP
jgi:hypothetical protein